MVIFEGILHNRNLASQDAGLIGMYARNIIWISKQKSLSRTTRDKGTQTYATQQELTNMTFGPPYTLTYKYTFNAFLKVYCDMMDT